ncbi:hypothetical protein I4U23_025917 [Adineta vaga]|nr:hypothetical protein I4U23_025917 [Adineta vaga]
MSVEDEKQFAEAALHSPRRKLTCATTHSKHVAHLYICEQLHGILAFNQQQSITRHKPIEDQFADPHGGGDSCDAISLPTTTNKTDELEKYLGINIGDIYKQPDPLPFWRDHKNKFLELLRPHISDTKIELCYAQLIQSSLSC